MDESTLPESREWTLEPETEYRFELDSGTSVALKLVRGFAEIFGAEIAEGKIYVFAYECKASVFTWQGCTLKVFGRPSTEYVSDETPMVVYSNAHIAFEQMRVQALRAIHGSPDSDDDTIVNAEPPRVLVVGPENSGKTTVCKILINYAVRTGQHWSPLLINLDPSEGGWAVPGTISAAPISTPLSTSTPSVPTGSSATSAPAIWSSNALLPLVYWYGHTETKRNPLLLDRLVRNMGSNVADRLENDPEGELLRDVAIQNGTYHSNKPGRASGIIVDTPSWFAASSSSGTQGEQRQNLIKSCVESFQINVILVVGHEKLNVEMQRAYGDRIPVVKILKSGGVVELDHAYRERVRNYQLYNYMYGQKVSLPTGCDSPESNILFQNEPTTDLTLSPSSTVVSFSDIMIYRIGGEAMAPSSALPIGASRVISELQPLLVDPTQSSSGLLNSVLALLAPRNSEDNETYDEEILDLHVIGFLIVTGMDVPNRKMTILSPGPSNFVGRTAIIASIEWQDI